MPHRSSRSLERSTVRVAHIASTHDFLDVRIFEKECRSLADAGYDVHMLVPGAPDGELNSGVHFHAPATRQAAPGPWRRVTLNHAMLKRAIDLQARIYHLHEPELIPIGLALKRRGAMVIYDAHEDAPSEAWTMNRRRLSRRIILPPLWRALLALARRRFDAFVAVTPEIAATFPTERTVEVRNYPRTELFTNGPERPSASFPTLIFAGLISETRGALAMLDAVGAVPASFKARLQLFGTTDRPETMTAMQGHTGWTRVDYMGRRPWREVIASYQSASIGLLLYEPTAEQLACMPVKLFELLLSGLPVVASDIPYWRSLLEGNPAVFFVPYGDAEAAARLISDMLSRPDDMRELGTQGAAHARLRVSWNSQAEKLIDLYDRLSYIG
jgi:glycosyltransferase involved in cell wall biosynthesis